MFTGLSRGIVGLAAAVTAPAALACENPDDIAYALRSEPPAIVNPGEVVLELDTGKMETVSKPPSVVETKGLKLVSERNYGVFNVKRVDVGSYTEAQATIRLGFGNSCWFLYGGPAARYLVASPTTDDDGFAYLATRPITGAELRAQRERDLKAPH